jgi:hypothetical protein
MGDEVMPSLKKHYYKEYYLKNREKIIARNKLNRLNNLEKYRVSSKKWREKHKAEFNKKQLEWYHKNKEEYNTRRNARAKLLRLNNYEPRKEYFKLYQRNKRATNILYKLHDNISRRIRKDLIRFNKKKKESTQKILPYNMAELQKHIEVQFTNEMSWENMGLVWEIDHIVPLNWAQSVEDILELWKLTNLRPLLISNNRIKSDKFCGDVNIALSSIGR